MKMAREGWVANLLKGHIKLSLCTTVAAHHRYISKF